MTHGERFYSTIALSYKLSYVQPDSQIWVRVINQSAGKKKILLSPESWDVQVQPIL